MKAALMVLVCGWCPVAVAMAAGPGLPASASTAKPVPAPVSGLNRHEVSYAIGYRIGSEFADGSPAVDMETLIKAVRDAYRKQPPAVSMHVMQEQLEILRQQMRRHAELAFRRMAEQNARRSAAFLRANSQKPGVVVLPSGVQYKVVEAGHGASPTASSIVVINYRGALPDGMKFDDSWARGKPVTYPVEDMLPGWRDVLPRMHVGARWKVFIPPEQAYGERGQMPRIGPNEALIFDIQLLGVKQH